MSSLIYGLCAATSALCAGMLLGSYRQNKYRLLLWSGPCFVGLDGSTVIDISATSRHGDDRSTSRNITLSSTSMTITVQNRSR